MNRRQYNRNADYDRVCVKCVFHQPAVPDRHNCHRPVDLVTGRGQLVDCGRARAVDGHCGPDGQRFSAIASVEAPTRKRVKA
jgi:hypothetical protein